jgi:hypothetical protein
MTGCAISVVGVIPTNGAFVAGVVGVVGVVGADPKVPPELLTPLSSQAALISAAMKKQVARDVRVCMGASRVVEKANRTPSCFPPN